MKKFYILFFLFYFFANPVNAQSNSIIVDLNFLIENSQKGKNIKKEISDRNEKNLNNFKEKEKKFQEEEKKLISKKKILSESDFEKEFNNFKKNVKKYNEEKKKKIQELKIFRNKKISQLLKEINSIILDYSKKNNISLVLDKKYVLLVKSENDVTDIIMNILNK